MFYCSIRAAKTPTGRLLRFGSSPLAHEARYYSEAATPHLRKTGLYDLHVQHGATMVPFGGFAMPVRYGNMTIGESHRWTRERSSLFDVGHMVQHRLSGPAAAHLLLNITPSSVYQLQVNRSALSCLLLGGTGGIVDDTVITRLGPETFHLVTNAACRDKDREYIASQIEALALRPGQLDWEIPETQGLIALQGPLSAEILQECQVDEASCDLSTLFFGQCAMIRLRVPSGGKSPPLMVTRTGYTGEDGFEISIPPESTKDVVSALLNTGGTNRVRLAGLGARDSLRLEAGMCLYGYELDEDTTPVEAGLSWIVGKDRREKGGFHGSDRILAQLDPLTREAAVRKRRVGLVVEGSPARGGAAIKESEDGKTVGRVTSGGPSVTLGKNIAMGYVESQYRKVGTPLVAVVRGKPQPAKVVKLPFVPAKYCKE